MSPWRRWLRWAPVGVVLLYVIWNAPLWWGLAQPDLVVLKQAVGVKAAGPQDVPANSFAYPRLGIAAPLTETPNASPLRVADWTFLTADLKKGVSLMYATPKLADASTVYITGHSSDYYPHPYSTVFVPLGQAKVGDLFYINGSSGLVTYKVTSTQIVAPTDIKAFTPTLSAGVKEAMLVTCWPPLTTWKRMLVIGQPI